MNFYLTLVVACFFLPSLGGDWGGVAYAQNKEGQPLIDSLLRELPKQKNDTRKVNLLNSISYNYQWVHAKKGIEYGKQALQLAEKLKWDKGMGIAQNNIGGNYNTLVMPDSVLLYCHAALQKGKQLNNNIIIANSLMNMGTGYFNLSDNFKALECFQQALPFAEKTGDRVLEAWVELSIGTGYHGLGQYDKAMRYFNKTLQTGEQTGNHLMMAFGEYWTGYCYYAMSKFDWAKDYYKKSLTTTAPYGFKELTAIMSGNIGNALINLSDYPAAMDFLQEGIKLSEETGNDFNIAYATGIMGVIYAYLSDDAQAIKYYQKGLKIAKQSGIRLLVASYTNNIGDCYERSGNYPQALKWYKEALRLNIAIKETFGNTALAYYNIGHIYYFLKDYAQAWVYGHQALNACREAGNTIYLSCTYALYSELCLQAPVSVLKKMHVKPSGRYNRALTYADSALHYARETGSIEDMMPAWKLLSEIHQKQVHPDKALEAFQTYILLRDSTTGIAIKNQITRKQMQFEFDKKVLSDSLQHADEKRLAALKLQKQKSLTYSGLAGVGTLLLFSVFVFKNYTTQKKTNTLLAKEKEKSEELLLNILPEEIAEELKEKGYAEAQQFDKVTVLFTDFVNFTQAGERMTPKELVEELDTCFKIFDGIIDKYKIEKIKTIGDAYLAVCGLPNADAQHAQHIIKAALDISAFMAERQMHKKDKTFEIRIGIHSGSVVAGIVGVKKFAYDIWGDAVNTAARMEQNSEAGKINVSETTFELVKDDFSCIYRGEIEAKNKGMMKMYFVSG